ncbi:MAG: hypothetical protein NZ556_06875 [Fimbriimonadales bacterium]|nr:hypothetical protein [Fimbriimonadales bacterium]
MRNTKWMTLLCLLTLSCCSREAARPPREILHAGVLRYPPE